MSAALTTSPPPNYIGANIKRAREAKKLTQLELGHLMGWSGDDAGAQISRFESGQKQPRITTLQRIAESLAVEIATLLKKI